MVRSGEEVTMPRICRGLVNVGIRAHVARVVTPAAAVITDENIALGGEVRGWIWQAAIRILRFAHSSCTVV